MKKLCTHVQVLGIVAMVKDEQQGCNASYCCQQPLLFSVKLLEMYCWQAAKRSHAAITELLLFRKSVGVILHDALPGSQRLCTNGLFENCQCVNVCEAAEQVAPAVTCC